MLVDIHNLNSSLDPIAFVWGNKQVIHPPAGLLKPKSIAKDKSYRKRTERIIRKKKTGTLFT